MTVRTRRRAAAAAVAVLPLLTLGCGGDAEPGASGGGAGETVGGATEASLKDRRNLAEEGVITVVAIVDADSGLLAEEPDFLARGFVHDESTFAAVTPIIEKALAKAAEEGVGGALQLEQLISRAVQNWAHRTYRRSPMIIPVVIDA